MDTGHIGRRIAYWRARRGLTQADFGRLMGKSRRWVQDLEGGLRQVDPRLSVLQQAAAALHISLEHLVAEPDEARHPSAGLPPETANLANSLHGLMPRDGPPPLAVLRRRIAYCCQAWATCHYTAAARDLPGLLADATRAASAGGSEAGVLLSRAYQLTASLLYKYGEDARTPGVLAADRALVAAEASGDAVAIGAASRRVARGLIHQQRPAAAASYAVAAATRLRPALERRGTEGLSTLGMLYLVAAIGATGSGRSPGAVSAATEHLRMASEVAQRQGDADADYTSFGPTNVALHQTDVFLRLDDAWSALEAAAQIDPAALSALSRERRARHLVTSARAQLLTRRRGDAARALLEAELLAPQELRRTSGQAVLSDLLDTSEQPGEDLRGLAQRCGLPA